MRALPPVCPRLHVNSRSSTCCRHLLRQARALRLRALRPQGRLIRGVRSGTAWQLRACPLGCAQTAPRTCSTPHMQHLTKAALSPPRPHLAHAAPRTGSASAHPGRAPCLPVSPGSGTTCMMTWPTSAGSSCRSWRAGATSTQSTRRALCLWAPPAAHGWGRSVGGCGMLAAAQGLCLGSSASMAPSQHALDTARLCHAHPIRC